MRHIPALTALVLASTVGLLGACGNDDSTATAVGGSSAAEPATVEIEQSRFTPQEVAVEAGGSVEFVNLDAYDHTVTSAEGSDLRYDSDPFGQDEVFTQVFDERGTYDYFCEIHPTMRATVTVS